MLILGESKSWKADVITYSWWLKKKVKFTTTFVSDVFKHFQNLFASSLLYWPQREGACTRVLGHESSLALHLVRETSVTHFCVFASFFGVFFFAVYVLKGGRCDTRTASMCCWFYSRAVFGAERILLLLLSGGGVRRRGVFICTLSRNSVVLLSSARCPRLKVTN